MTKQQSCRWHSSLSINNWNKFFAIFRKLNDYEMQLNVYVFRSKANQREFQGCYDDFEVNESWKKWMAS